MKRSVLCASVRAASGLLAGAVLLLAGCAGPAGGESGNARVPQPAKAVDLDRYVGRWYEFARYENRFERGCDGVTADYAKRADGLIGVRNTCREGEPDGRARSSDGRAKIVANSSGAKLKVSFFGPFFWGDYWILDHADDYSWSIVGEPSGRFLWILTRVAKPSPEQAAALVERVRTLGYDTAMLRRTAH
ncbi:lipocalin family protein [Burkholderia cenocepacia]|uniref:lipocalin family protein n=1 Tax=Burkholderia cenocepacia TaxID=95486 RepID=UPI001CF4A5DD|nr:lipocalin family protein [Burkholderia cenocepacia]MCA7924296.1 lipocalin family protein [Burkholderia cenocepacia]